MLFRSALTNQTLYVHALEAKHAATGELLWTELEGADVVSSDGTRLGRIVALYNAGASDVLTVEGDAGRQVEIPVVDAYVGAEIRFEDKALHLVVPASTFAEVWNDAGGEPDDA